MTELLRTEFYHLIEARHGHFLANPKDNYLGGSMIRYGEFSEIEWMLLEQLIHPGNVVVEAGANMGVFTVPLAKKVGRRGMVYAFEPQMTIFQQLCANLALNDLVNVQAFNAGCGDESAWLPIRRVDPARSTNFGGLSLKMLESQSPVRVRVERLDDVLDVSRLNLIKADVEGMELQVLRGASGLIKQHRPRLYLEANEPEGSAELYDLLTGWDYRLFWHLPPMYNPENHAGDGENIFGRTISMNILCLPAEQGARIKRFRAVSGRGDHPKLWGKA
ncbi:MAG: FkbM family methyltransferase [Pseudomonadota bacterium]